MKRRVRNCKDQFSFVCPKEWDKLEPTEADSVRFCAACREKVYFCDTDEETIRRAREGQCVARAIPDSSKGRHIMVGRPETPPKVATPEEIEAEELQSRESGIARALADVKYSHRVCPECKYPAPDWKKTCVVCGFEIGRV